MLRKTDRTNVDGALFFASPSDVQVAAIRRVGRHSVALPYEHLGGMEFTLASNEPTGRPHTTLVIENATYAGAGDDGAMRFRANGVVQAGDVEVWRGTIDAVFPGGNRPPYLEFDTPAQHASGSAPDGAVKSQSGREGWRGAMGDGPEPGAMRARESAQEVGAGVPAQPRSAQEVLAEPSRRTADQLPEGSEQRGDAERLGQHALAIDRHELRGRMALRDAMARGAGDDALGAHKARITEADGERAATKFMLTEEPGTELVRGFAVGDGFDQIWVRRGASGEVLEYVIVEAKGVSGKLGGTKHKGKQMSDEWVTATADEMARSGTPEEKQLARRLLQALADGRPPISGRVIVSDGAGGYVDVTLEDFPLGVPDGYPAFRNYPPGGDS